MLKLPGIRSVIGVTCVPGRQAERGHGVAAHAGGVVGGPSQGVGGGGVRLIALLFVAFFVDRGSAGGRRPGVKEGDAGMSV